MEYLFAPKRNYEDYSSGRVIYHKSGLSTFPVRLASEVFMRCAAFLPETSSLRLYDPMCGEAYLLTTIGMLHADQISKIYASDISQDALDFAIKNLDLLTKTGLQKRKSELEGLFEQYGKWSHQQAIEACERILAAQTRELDAQLFQADILGETPLENAQFKADIVITDVPYGSMVGWSSSIENPIDHLLKKLLAVIERQSVVAVISDKAQKASSPLYQRLKLLKAGKRRVEILRLR
ncbi:MAG: hypothetical protein AAF927_25835 [Bacteroidota bacterium]